MGTKKGTNSSKNAYPIFTGLVRSGLNSLAPGSAGVLWDRWLGTSASEGSTRLDPNAAGFDLKKVAAAIVFCPRRRQGVQIGGLARSVTKRNPPSQHLWQRCWESGSFPWLILRSLKDGLYVLMPPMFGDEPALPMRRYMYLSYAAHFVHMHRDVRLHGRMCVCVCAHAHFVCLYACMHVPVRSIACLEETRLDGVPVVHHCCQCTCPMMRNQMANGGRRF